MAHKKSITPEIHPEERLQKLSNTFLSFTSDPVDNIYKLVHLLADLLNAHCCTYHAVDRSVLYSTARWHNHEALHTGDTCHGHICFDVIQPDNEDPYLLRNIHKSEYRKDDPCARDHGIRSYYSKSVEYEGKRVGLLCALFTSDFTPGPSDSEIIGILSSAISVQESLLRKMNLVRLKEEKFRSLIHNAPKIAIQFYDQNGVVKYWNMASEILYGYSEKEAVGRSLDQLILSGEDFSTFLENLKKISVTRETVSTEWDLTDRYGARHKVISTIFEIDDQNGGGQSHDFVCMDIDVTEVRTAEIKLKEYANQLENLNSTKDKFFSIIAHDLKNPFNTILGFSRLLADEYNALSDEEILGFIKTIRDASDNAFKLLQNLLSWARLQTGHIEYSPELINLGLTVNETIALVKPQAIAKRLTLATTVSPACQAYADENMIKTVMRNLITNAIKYSFPGNRVEVSATESENSVSISVSDKGIGINPALFSRLFSIEGNRERPGTHNETGTGLGLILCKEFISLNRGEISVFSEEGKGSTFTFTLPKFRN